MKCSEDAREHFATATPMCGRACSGGARATLQRRGVVLALVTLLAACAAPATTPDVVPRTEDVKPRFAASGPDAEAYGASTGYPKGTRANSWGVATLVGTHSHLDEIFQSRLIRRAPTPSPLARVAEPPITWTFENRTLTLDDYLVRNPVTGLLIVRGDAILVERYQYGRTDRHRFTSWSMAKTLTAMLVGIAIAEGHIRSVDDLAAVYTRELAGTGYGNSSIRNLLQMSSGVKFIEQYTGDDDATKLAANTFLLTGPGGASAVTPYNERAAPAGTKFYYASGETHALGLVLLGATNHTPASYLQSRLWQRIGTEADASWLVDNAGQESTYCCFNAVLRDYARLGILLAHDGNWRGRQIIPAQWILDATTVRPDQPHLRPGTAHPFFGYGYQTWILPGERRMFSLRGIRGQAIYVDPRSKLVMVQTGVHKGFVDLPHLREMGSLWNGVVRQLGG